MTDKRDDLLERLAALSIWCRDSGYYSVNPCAEAAAEIASLRAALREASAWFLRPENIDLSGSDRIYILIDEALSAGQQSHD